MSRILYLFADTNLFIQCRALSELDWSAWVSFDEVHVIVSRPVQREIDYRKNKGSDRVGDRSRATNKIFREIVRSDKDHMVIRDVGPCVKLYLKPEFNHDPDLAERLNYSERDDQIIGTISTFKKQNPEADVRLLTDDGTPMATAKSLQIAVVDIPESWLLPPETTEAEKKLGLVQAELARLKKAEPQFRIRCLDATGKPIEKLEYHLERFEALTVQQITGLMIQIANGCPMETDFGQRESTEPQSRKNLSELFGVNRVFIPASDEDITAYREKHSQWLESCGDFLRDYHITLNNQSGPQTFSFAAVNDGARPGKDALVTIEAKGDIQIMPPHPATDKDDDDDEGSLLPRSVKLPQAPLPPQGKWRNEPLLLVDSLRDTFGGLSGLRGDHHLMGIVRPEIGSLLHNIKPFRRDPNSFYYKPERPMRPVSLFSLECEQWRHGADEKEFLSEIHFDCNAASVSGALECTIHAENLSASEVLCIPVRITVKSVSVLDRAEKLVRGLTASVLRLNL